LSLSAAFAGWLRSVAQCERKASMSLFAAHSDATAGIVDAVIVAEAMRAISLLIAKLHRTSCCEETYRSAGLFSIARESFDVRLWLCRLNPWFRKKRRRGFVVKNLVRQCACCATSRNRSAQRANEKVRANSLLIHRDHHPTAVQIHSSICLFLGCTTRSLDARQEELTKKIDRSCPN